MLTFLFTLWVLPLTLSYLYTKKNPIKDRLSYIAFHLFFHDIALNGVCYFFNKNTILNYLSPDFSFYLYIIFGGFLCLPLSYKLYQGIITNKGISVYRTITFLFLCLLSFCYVYFGWLLGESGRLSFEVFLYNIQNPINTEVANFDIQIFGLCCYCIALFLSLWYLFYQSPLFKKVTFHSFKHLSLKRRIISMLLPITSLVLVVWYPYYCFHFDDAYTYLYASNTFIEEHYVDPSDVNLTWPKEKRNLIYIFIESFESSSFSKELGGMRDINLLPQLQKLMPLGTTFSDKAEGYGGGMSMPQATVTLSGITAYLGGVNYKLPVWMENNDYASVIPQLTTLTDLLKEQGYHQEMIVGMDVDGYYVGPFFRQHGDAITKGYDEVIEEGRLPEDYAVWWGFEDSKLYQFAKEDILSIANTDEPFVYTLISNNTHRVDGYTEETCTLRDDVSFPMENAIYCEDQLVSEFLDWIMKQSFYENTTVVIVGDHLGHAEAYTETLQPQEERRIFNLILNADKEQPAQLYPNRQFWSADFFPTVLSAMGVEMEGERLGLGTNLFSNQKTLIEEYGYAYVSEQLAQQSKFYTEAFLQVEK